MDSLIPTLPRSLKTKLENSYTDSQSYSAVEIEISLVLYEGDLSVRDLSAYLEMADRVYGRTFETGLIGYAQRPIAQLRITQVRKGSTELIIADSILNYLREPGSSLIYLFLFLKYGPTALKTLGDAARSIVETKKAFWEIDFVKANTVKAREEAELAKVSRKQIVEAMRNDSRLRGLEERERASIRKLINRSAKHERHLIPSTRRFASHSIKSLDIRLRSRTER